MKFLCPTQPKEGGPARPPQSSHRETVFAFLGRLAGFKASCPYLHSFSARRPRSREARSMDLGTAHQRPVLTRNRYNSQAQSEAFIEDFGRGAGDGNRARPATGESERAREATRANSRALANASNIHLIYSSRK